jgi:hypothetical protein
MMPETIVRLALYTALVCIVVTGIVCALASHAMKFTAQALKDVADFLDKR